MSILITSQSYINEDVVAEKIQNEDYDVLVSPIFEVDGIEYQVLIDGHHSFHAALEAGATVNYTVATTVDHDAIALLEEDIDLFLEALCMGDIYREVETGRTAF